MLAVNIAPDVLKTTKNLDRLFEGISGDELKEFIKQFFVSYGSNFDGRKDKFVPAALDAIPEKSLQEQYEEVCRAASRLK